MSQKKKSKNQKPSNPKKQPKTQSRALLNSKGTISWGRVSSNVIADGDFFFIEKTTQKNGIWPAAIHNNYVIGGDNKRQRFVNTSLWLIDEDDDMKCKPMVPIPPPFPGNEEEPTVAIKILSFDRPQVWGTDIHYPSHISLSSASPPPLPSFYSMIVGS